MDFGRVSTGDRVEKFAESWFGPSPDAAASVEGNNPAETRPTPTTAEMIISERRIRRMRVVNLCLRVAAVVFCFLAFVIMACNNNNGNIKVRNVDSFVYLVSITVIVFIYSLLQSVKAFAEIRSQRPLGHAAVFCTIDFFGDLLCAFLLMSCASAAASASTGLMKNVGVNSFSQTGAASVAMAFFAAFTVAASSVFSSFNFAKYIRW